MQISADHVIRFIEGVAARIKEHRDELTQLVSTVGGASGPLYGTAFMRAGMALADRYELTEAEVVAALEAALEGIMARGKARRGEKTMVDAIAPGIDVLKEAQANGEDFRAA